MDFFGLSIGASSAKLVQLNQSRKGLNLEKIGSIDLPPPGIEAETKNQFKETALTVKKLVNELEPSVKNVAFSLPEEKVTTKIKWFPSMKEKEIGAALKYEAETFIPHPLDKVELDYQIIDKDEQDRLLVFTVGVLKSEVKKYTEIAEYLDLKVIAIEPESVSLNRALSVENLLKIIVDIKSKQTSLVVVKNRAVYLTRTIPIGFHTFSRAIRINLGLKENEAEAYRKTYGLRDDELEGKVKQAMLPIVEKLAREIKQTALSYQKDWNQNVDVISLSGVGAYTPRLTELITKNLGIEAQIAEPFKQIIVPDNLKTDLDKKSAVYSVTCGLASRGLKEI